MSAVNEHFIASAKEWFPQAHIETDPNAGTDLKIRLTETVYVEELGKERKTNPIIINASEDVLSDLSHMDDVQRHKALKTIGDFVHHQLRDYDPELTRDPLVTTHPFRIDIPTSVY